MKQYLKLTFCIVLFYTTSSATSASAYKPTYSFEVAHNSVVPNKVDDNPFTSFYGVSLGIPMETAVKKLERYFNKPLYKTITPAPHLLMNYYQVLFEEAKLFDYSFLAYFRFANTGNNPFDGVQLIYESPFDDEEYDQNKVLQHYWQVFQDIIGKINGKLDIKSDSDIRTNEYGSTVSTDYIVYFGTDKETCKNNCLCKVTLNISKNEYGTVPALFVNYGSWVK